MNNSELEIYTANCQKLLHLVGELYKRGYKSIRPAPNVSDGTGRWRLLLYSGKPHGILVHQWFADLGKPEIPYDEYEKTACPLTVEQLADQFIKDHHLWLQESMFNSVDGELLDELFIEWYQIFLTMLEEGDSVCVDGMDANNEEPRWLTYNFKFKSKLELLQEVIPCDFSSLGLPLSSIVKISSKLLRTCLKHKFGKLLKA